MWVGSGVQLQCPVGLPPRIPDPSGAEDHLIDIPVLKLARQGVQPSGAAVVKPTGGSRTREPRSHPLRWGYNLSGSEFFGNKASFREPWFSERSAS